MKEVSTPLSAILSLLNKCIIIFIIIFILSYEQLKNKYFIETVLKIQAPELKPSARKVNTPVMSDT